MMEHLSPTAQLSNGRPSFFEVYAAQHLNTALRPAIRFLIDVISLRHPLLRPLSTWSDETFTLLLLLIESAQLTQHSSLLAESFYALRRSPAPILSPPTRTTSTLSTYQVALALFLDVICPYINEKVNAAHASATGGAAADLFDSDSANAPTIVPAHLSATSSVVSASATSAAHAPSETLPSLSDRITATTTSCPPRWLILLRQLLSSPQRALSAAKALVAFMRTQRFRTLLLRHYPIFKALVDACNMLLGMLYLYGYSRYFSLSLLIQRVALRRDSHLDFLRLAVADKLQRPSRLHGIKVATLRVLSLLKTGFLASIFAFRFLQYYYSAEASAPRDVGSVLPPPEPLHPAEGVDRDVALASGMCPICEQPRVNPTACVTSGFVFCYLCIVPHVQLTSRCPVTMAPTAVDDLVRVYEDGAAL